MLNADRIIAEAEAKVGFTDPEPQARRNLTRLIDALAEMGGLSDEGEAISHRNFVSDTVSRLEGLKWCARHPEIEREPIAAPVFLTGLPRSGTTYFQYLFDRDRRFRLIRTWESLAPSPPPGADPASAEERKREWAEKRARDHPSFEGFDALHLIDEDGSEECHAFLQQTFGAAGLNNLFRVPSFFDYLLDEADIDYSYHVHKRQLQLLQWRQEPKPWAVKYPNHVLAMDAIRRVHPDARFVMTHRDPAQTLASISKMSFKLRGLRTGGTVDKAVVGRDMLHFIGRHVDRLMEFANGPDGGCVFHVDYYALVEDPVREIGRVHDWLDIGTPDDVAEAMAAWRAANPKNKRGRNDYSLAQYGLDDGEVMERFAAYRSHFDISRERDGLARAGAA